MAKEKKRLRFLSSWQGYILLAIIGITGGIITHQTTRADAYTLQGKAINWQGSAQWRIINYFAPWCTPCRREIPSLNILSTSLPDSVVIYGVSYDSVSQNALPDLVAEMGIQFDVIVLQEETVMPASTPSYLPATFIISPQGEVKARLFGEQTQDSMLKKLRALQVPGIKDV